MHIQLEADEQSDPPLRLVDARALIYAAPIESIDLGVPPVDPPPGTGGGGRDGRRFGRYLLMLVLGVALIWLPAILFTLYSADKFRSEWSILIPGNGVGSSVNLDQLGQASTSVRSAYASSAVDPKVNYKAIASSSRVLRDAAERAGVEATQFPKPNIRLIDQTSILEITLKHTSAEGAQLYSESLYAALEAELARLRRTERERLEAGNLEQLDEYRRKVNNAQAALLAFREGSSVASAGQYQSMIEAVGTLDLRRDDAAVRLAAHNARRQALADALGLDPARAADVLRLQQDAILRSRVDSYSRLHAEYVEIAASLGSQHPKVLIARSRSDSARTVLEARAELTLGYSDPVFIERYVASLDGGGSNLFSQLVAVQAEHAGVAAELAQLDSQAPRIEKRVRDSAADSARLQDLERSHQIAETVFLSTLAKLDLSKSDVYASYPVTQLLVEPSLPAGPEQLERLLVLAGAFVGSLFVLFALAISWNRDILLRQLSKSA